MVASIMGWFPVLASLLHIRPPLHRGDGSHGCGKAYDYRGIFIRTTIFCYTLIRFMFFIRARCFQLQFQRWSRPPLPRSTSCQWPQASSNWKDRPCRPFKITITITAELLQATWLAGLVGLQSPTRLVEGTPT